MDILKESPNQELQKELNDLNNQFTDFNEEDFEKTSKEAIETFKGTNKEAKVKAELMSVRRDRARQKSLTEQLTKSKKILTPKTRAEMIGLKKKTNPPLERKTNSSRFLEQQTNRLENQLEITPEQSAPQPEQVTNKGSFTEWANNNNVEPTNHKKTLWKLSGGELTENEKQGFNENDNQTFSDIENLSDFSDKSLNERNEELTQQSETQKNMETEIDNLDKVNIRAGGKSYGMEIARGIHPTNLALGYFTGKAADSIMNNYINKYLPNQSEPLKTVETGAIAGGLTSTLLGTALLPETLAGGAGYLTQKYATEGIYKGLKDIGASDDVAGVGASTAGGSLAGGVGGFLGAFAAGALAGGEEGSIAGLGVASAETGLIGAAIGGVIGLGSYAWGKIHG